MENIKFIRECMLSSDRGHYLTAGNFLLFPMKNGNVAKTCCESNGVRVEIVNKKDGIVDRVLFPFANYFKQKQCSPGAPLWDQHIENGEWYSSQYKHCLPTHEDYECVAKAVDKYIKIMEE
ncbi:MAG: hypothetical protein IKU94_04125 [Bacteroidaceae bacterium]|nr:hypothetical protein [Bacteroidaceae bacterium]